MKFSLVLIFSVLMLVRAVQAQESPRPVHFLLAAGSEFRSEKNAEGNFVGQNLTNAAIGFGFQNFIFIFEQAQFQESSGNSTLSIARHFQDDLVWAQWRGNSWTLMVPFVAGGVGVYREKIDTQLAGTSMSNQSKDKLLTGAGFGVGLDVPYLWLSLEARILFGDELDRQPTLGGLAQVGISF